MFARRAPVTRPADRLQALDRTLLGAQGISMGNTACV